MKAWLSIWKELDKRMSSSTLQSYNIKLVKSSTCPGNIVPESGLKPVIANVRAITQLPLPQSKEELQRFLGMVNYFSQFIPNQSEITAPLRNLMKKDVMWIWSHEHTQAAECLKQIFSCQPVLKFYGPTKPVQLQVDASKPGLGACVL